MTPLGFASVVDTGTSGGFTVVVVARGTVVVGATVVVVAGDALAVSGANERLAIARTPTTIVSTASTAMPRIRRRRRRTVTRLLSAQLRHGESAVTRRSRSERQGNSL